METASDKPYIITLDIGTTCIKCHIFAHHSMESLYSKSSRVRILHPHEGSEEIDPDFLWKAVTRIVRDTIKESEIKANDVCCMGLSSQRNTFLTWNRNTLKPFHNFITWKDVRSEKLVKIWNKSLILKVIRNVSYLLYMFTGNHRYLIASLFKFNNAQVTMRLLWQLENNIKLKEAVSNGTALFGTVDTWLLYRLTKGNIHVTDTSCASATGLYDPFILKWAFISKILNIPTNLLPNVCDSAGPHFGSVSADIWGSPIKIMCSVADQSASFYGSCCFYPGDVKITLGTGAFLNVNVGSQPIVSKKGFYPLICWKYKEDVVCILEGACYDCGTLIDWAQAIGIFENIEELNGMVKTVSDTNGVYFIPAFTGLQVPVDDVSAAAGFIGLKFTTHKAHLARAILESIVFQVYELYSVHKNEWKTCSKSYIRVDGGVSNNDFICQCIADLCEVYIRRPSLTEMSSRGVAFLAGAAYGIWKSEEILNNIEATDVLFEPKKKNLRYLSSQYENWKKAQHRFTGWYKK